MKNLKNYKSNKEKELTYGKNTTVKFKDGTKRSFYYADLDYENYWGDEASDYHVKEWNSFELQYDDDNTFQIGNNMKGGI